MIHGGVIVSHSRHAAGGLTAVALTLRSCVAFAQECADPGRSSPEDQDRQENYRICGSSGHFWKLYLKLYEMRKLKQGLSLTVVSSAEPREKGRGNSSDATYERIGSFCFPAIRGSTPEFCTLFSQTRQEKL
jgi:hypothetical protein